MKTLAHIYELLVREHLLVELCQGTRRLGAPGQTSQTLLDWLSAIALCGADCDSRVVEPHHLFFCKGQAFRAVYLDQALKAGACAWMAEPALASSLKAHRQELGSTGDAEPLGFVVSNIRRAMALVSAEAWDHPDHEVLCLGITGTKGKTTTATFLRALMEAAGYPSAFMGTHEVFDGKATLETATTTPEAPDLWRYLAHARSAGLKACVMEVSSQALKYERTLGLTFEVAALLNIGNDHISPIEHPSFEDYLASKLRIFTQAKRAVINADMEHAQAALKAAKGLPLALFGHAAPRQRAQAASTPAQPSAYEARNIKTTSQHTNFVAHTPQGAIAITLAMSGLFNAENALAALAMAGSLGIDLKSVAPALSQCRVAGRMELFCSPDERLVCLVDYAHNDNSYHKFFETVAAGWPGSFVVSVFGVSGGKALDRYEDLPRIASAESNYLVLTSDDPGPEDPQKLVDLIATHVDPTTPFSKEPDREKAVELGFDVALTHWRQGERVVLCLLGKGCENALYLQDGAIPIENDVDHIQRLMKEEGLLPHNGAPKPSAPANDRTLFLAATNPSRATAPKERGPHGL